MPEEPDRWTPRDKPRFICPHCHRDYASNPDGTLRKHRDFDQPFARGRNRKCPGAGERPKQMWVSIFDEWRMVPYE